MESASQAKVSIVKSQIKIARGVLLCGQRGDGWRLGVRLHLQRRAHVRVSRAENTRQVPGYFTQALININLNDIPEEF